MGNNPERYCEYVHNLHRITGISDDIVVRDILPLRDIPHKADPRRERSLQLVLDIQFSNESRYPPINEDLKPEGPEDIPWVLRRIVVPPRRSAPLTDAAHMPNSRDPRRFRACQRRGAPDSLIGPPNLVDNPEVPAEEETCPVFTTDLTDWPRSAQSYVELIPHECNILRASEFACADDSSEQLLDYDNKNVNVLLETMRRRDSEDVVEIGDDDVTEVSGYDAGDGNKPMLAMDDSGKRVYELEQPAKHFLGDDELPPIPVVKSESMAERPVPSFDDTNIDVVDLCDDEEDGSVKLAIPKRERSSSVECVGVKTHGVLEVITLDSDDDEDSMRNTADGLPSESTPAEQHVFTECPRISSPPGSERKSHSNRRSNAPANEIRVLREVSPMQADAEDSQVQGKVNINYVAEFNELWESMKDNSRPKTSINLYAAENDDEMQTTKTDAGPATCEASEQPMELETDGRKIFDNDSSHVNDKTDKQAPPRRISIVTSDAFDAQKKLLIDVILNSNHDTSLEEAEMRNCSNDESTGEQAIPTDAASERLQQVISDMTCANYLGRSIFTNSSSASAETFAASEKRKRQETPEMNDTTQPKKKRRKRRRRKSEKSRLDQSISSLITNDTCESRVPNAIALLQKKAFYNTPPITCSTIFNINRILLDNLINYVRNYNIARSTIEFMLAHSRGELSAVAALRIVNETFWRNRFNHWNHDTWDKDSKLSISEDTTTTLLHENEAKNQVINASYFLKYPALKTNKLPMEWVIKRTSQNSKSYSFRHNLEVNSETKHNEEFRSKEFSTNKSLEIKKIKKRHSLPTATVPQHYSCLQRSRSRSHDSWNDHFNSVSSIKLKLTRDQFNQQNWIASNSQESSSIYSENDILGRVDDKLDSCKEKNVPPKTLVSNEDHTEVKASYHLTIDLSKFQPCINKTVPELDNNDYINKPVNNNLIDKHSLEKNLSPFLKSRIKRNLHEVIDTEYQSTLTSKRQKLSETVLITRTNININIRNDVNNHFNDKRKQEKSLELSKSLNDCSKKDLPKNFKNNFSNLNISLTNGDNYEKKNKIHIRSESNRTLQVDHNSNIAKETHKKQRLYSLERNQIDIHRKKKRKSLEMDKRKKKKFIEMFGDSDSDALEIISNPSTLDTDDDYNSDAYYENVINLDKKNIDTSMEKISLDLQNQCSEIEPLLSTIENCIDISSVNLEIKQNEHLSSSMLENKKSNEVFDDKFEIKSHMNKSTEHLNNVQSEKSNKQSEKSYENSMSPEQEKNLTENILSSSIQKINEVNESFTKSETISIKPKEFLDGSNSEIANASSEYISLNRISETNELEAVLEENSSSLITKKELLKVAIENQNFDDLNDANSGISDDNSVLIIDLQEGDFDFEVDNHSDYSYDGCVNLDDTESEDSCCIIVQSIGGNENTNSQTLKSEEKNLLISNEYDGKTEKDNDLCLMNECITETHAKIPEANVNNNGKGSASDDSKTDSKDENIENSNKMSKNNINDNDNKTTTIDSKIDEEILFNDSYDNQVNNNDNWTTILDSKTDNADENVDKSPVSSNKCNPETSSKISDNNAKNNNNINAITDSKTIDVDENKDKSSVSSNRCNAEASSKISEEKTAIKDLATNNVDECIIDVPTDMFKNDGNNSKGSTIAESVSVNLNENNVSEIDNGFTNSNDQTIRSDLQVQNEVLLNNVETVPDNSLILKDITEPSNRSIFAPTRKFYDDLKDPKISNEYNMFIDVVSEITNNKNLDINIDVEKQNVKEFFDKIDNFLEITIPVINLEEQNNRLIENVLGYSVEDFKKYNIHFVDIDTDEINGSNVSIDNNSTVNSFKGTFKVRNINELLEKPSTLSPIKSNVTNEKTVAQVEMTPTADTNSLTNLTNTLKPNEQVQLNAISNSIFSSLDQLILMVNSVPSSSQTINQIGSNNVPTTVPQINNQSCKNLLPNTLLQSKQLPNNSQICIKLASNIFSNEFSTAEELPTIYSMESPPADTLKLLLPRLMQTADLKEYKKQLIKKLYSKLEFLEKLPRKSWIILSNNLMKYEILTKTTWKFQRTILTIMQCISRLIFCATGENKRRIIEIIKKTQAMSNDKQFCLTESILLYKKLSDQGLCQKHIFLYDPLLTKTKFYHNSRSDLDSKMSNDQMNTFLQQITFYRSCQKLPSIKIGSSASTVSNLTTNCQINSLQVCSSNVIQMTLSTGQNENVQILHQKQQIQIAPIPNSTSQSNIL